jgi:NADH-quinone oxidoreductase subunit J
VVVGVILLLELLLVGGSFVMAPQVSGASVVPIDHAVDNTRALGQVIYTRYVFLFQGAGAVLLVAMVGAIVLTLQHKASVKRQNIARQTQRTRAEATELVKVKSGQGI